MATHCLIEPVIGAARQGGPASASTACSPGIECDRTSRSMPVDAGLVHLTDAQRAEIVEPFDDITTRAWMSESDVARKLTALADIRSAEGYMARLETLADKDFLLVEDHCPICAAAISCQGFCSIELQVFRNLLGPGWHVDREDHLLTGARRCAYRITPAAKPQKVKRGRNDSPIAKLRDF
jgi:hypothetical protein